MKKIFTLIAITMVAVCANAQIISFSEAISSGSLDGKTFENGNFKITVTDTDGKCSVDANNAYFGTSADDKVSFSYRLKSGGKSSSKNTITVTVPSEGVLKIYARTGSNSATDRDVIVTQNGEVALDKIMLESEAIEEPYVDDSGADKIRKIYPIATSSTLAAGEATITYPIGSINFYAFEFVSTGGSTPTETVKISELEGVYYVVQTGTTWFTTDWSAAELSLNYKSTVTVDGTKVSLSNIDEWGDSYALTGDYDETTNTITFAPTTMSWYTAAGSGAKTESFTATVSKDADAIQITFKPWSFYYGDNSYENTTLMVATRAGDIPKAKTEWEKEATITWVAKDGSTFYSGKGKIANISGVDYQYEVTGVGSNAASSPATVQFSVEEGVVVLKNGTYDSTHTGGYWYYLLQEKNDDAWFEGGEGCTFTGNETDGTCKFCYWYYTYDEETKAWSDVISQGYVTIAWGNTTAIKSVSSDNTTSTLYDLQGRKLNAAPSKGMYIQNGKKYLAK